VLISVMIHGLKPGRVRRIREALQIDSRRTAVDGLLAPMPQEMTAQSEFAFSSV
jgi:hypothetical protein